MAWQWTPHMVLPLMAAATLLITALYIFWRRRHRSVSRTGALVLMACAELMVAYMLEMGSINLSTKVFWSKMQYVGLLAAPTAWLAYTLQYTGREKWLTRRTLSLLCIVPLSILLLLFTNEAHGLIWRYVWLNTDGPFPALGKSYGVGFWVFVMYLYILLLLATSLHIQLFIRSRRLYRWQASALMLATLLPWLGSILDVFKLSPLPRFVPTSSGILLGGLIVTLIIYRARRGDILAVSRGAIFENINDSVVVLDAENRIVDLNPAAQHLIGRAASEAIGQPVGQVWPDWPGRTELRGGAVGSQDMVLGEGDRQRTYNVRISPLVDWRGQLVGQVIVLRDITEREEAEEALQRSVIESQNLINIAQILRGLDEPPQVMNIVVERIVASLNYDFALVTRYAEEENVFIGLGSYPMSPTKLVDQALAIIENPELREDVQRLQLPHRPGVNPMIDRVLDGEIIVGDSLADLLQSWVSRPTAEVLEKLSGMPSYIILPMQAKGKTVGTILAGVRKGPITANQQQALARVASQVAVAIENARLYEAEHWRSAELARSNAFIAALGQVAARIGSRPGPDQVMETLGAELRRLGLTCLIGLVEPDDEVPVIHYTSIESAALASVERLVGFKLRDFRIPRELWPDHEMGERGRASFGLDPIALTAAIAPYVPKLAIEHAVQLAGVTPDTTMVYLPLTVEDQAIGGLVVWGPDLRENDVPALSVLAGQVAAAIENARLYRAERAQRLRTETLQAAGATVSSILDLDAVLDSLLTELGKVIPYDSASVVLVEGDHLHVVAGRGLPASEMVGQRFPSDDPLLQEIECSRRPLILNDAQRDPRFQGRDGTDYVRGWMGVPLLTWEGTIGFLTIDSQRPATYTQADAYLATSFANQAAIAVKNAQLFGQAQQEIAERKRTLEALRESEERYRRLVELSFDAIAIHREGEIVYINATGAELFGASSPEELVGKPILGFVHPDQLEIAKARMLQTIGGRIAPLGEEKLIRLDGTGVDAEVVGVPIIYQGQPAVQVVIRDITARKRAEEQIKASLEEKEVLLQEVHHRVKNNLQVISSLLYLQSKNVKDQQAFEILQDSQNRVRSMTLVHEQLYQSKDLARIDFAEYVENLVGGLFRSYGVHPNVIKLEIHVDDVSLGIDTVIPCGLILNELVSNSLKHAFPDGREGKICIELCSDDEGECSLTVSDNGVGLPKDLDFRNTESLGLQLVNTLVGQLDGSIELDSDGGTAFEIIFAEPMQREGGSHDADPGG